MGRRTGVGGATKSVAVKFIIPSKTASERHREMFVSEARLSMMLSHSNVIQVFDAGEDQGRLYMVMEWVDGMNLSQLLGMMRSAGQLPTLSVAGFVIGEVLKGLAYAHNLFHEGRQITIVHRDISPQNVLVSVSGEVKLLDFGVARLAQEETSGIHIKGKLRYMAPEHLGGNSKAPTVDIYGAGAILHELIDGQKFRAGADEMQLYNQILGGHTPPLSRADVPAALSQLRAGMLDPDEHRRTASADQALEALEAWPGYRSAAGELSRLVRGFMGVAAPRSGIHMHPAGAPGGIDALADTAQPSAGTAATATRGGSYGDGSGGSTHPELSTSQPGTDPSGVPVNVPTVTSSPLAPRRSALPLLLGAGAGMLVAAGAVAMALSMKGSAQNSDADADADLREDEASVAVAEQAPGDVADDVSDADPTPSGVAPKEPSDGAGSAGAGGQEDEVPGSDTVAQPTAAPESEVSALQDPAEPSPAEEVPPGEVETPAKSPTRRAGKGRRAGSGRSKGGAAKTPKPPGESAVTVRITFKLKSPLRLAYVRIDGKETFAVEPMVRRKLSVGPHKIHWRESKDRPFVDGGTIDIRETGAHTIRISTRGIKLE